MLLVGSAVAAEQPVGWLAVHSLERAEGRINELVAMAEVEGLDHAAGAMVGAVAEMLGGVDPTRPIGLAMVRYAADEVPPMVLWIPYDDDARINALLARYYPEARPDAQGRLHLGRDGALNLVAIFDPGRKVVRIAADPRYAGPIEGPDALFDSPKAPDAVLTFDLAAYRAAGDPYNLAPAARFAALARLATGGAQSVLSQPTEVLADVVTALDRDADRVELALRVTPGGAAVDVSLTPRAASPTHVFLRHQLDAHPHAVSRLATNRAEIEDLPIRLWWSVRPPEAERERVQAALRALHAVALGTDGARSLVRKQVARWSDGGAVSGGLDVRGTVEAPQVTVAYVTPHSEDTLTDVLDYLGRLDRVAPGPPRLQRDIGRHYGIAVHHRSGGRDDPGVFLAAADEVLAVHFGTASAPVTGYLDAFRSDTPAPLGRGAVLGRLELRLAAATRAGYGRTQGLLGDCERPLVLELRARRDRLTLRAVLPDGVFRALGEALRAGLDADETSL